MKTKNIIKLISLSLVLAFTTSCSDEFLDTEPTQFISSDDFGASAALNPALSEAVLSGIYSTMIAQGDRVDEYGHKGMDLWGDILSCDVANSTNVWGWYRDFANLQVTVDNTQRINRVGWSYYYEIIRAANVFIKSSGGNDFVPETAAGKHAMGQAKAIRGYAYFYLAQFFTNGYEPAEKFLPLMTDPDQELQPQSTNEEIYAQIIKDLTEAITLLDGYNRSAKNKINQNVARALLAYTYGAIGTMDANQKAYTLTSQILASTPATIMTNDEVAGGATANPSVGGFDKIDTSGWIWGFDLTPAMGFGLTSWWAMMDQYTYGYQSAGNLMAINDNLFAEMPANDIRRTQFTTNPSSSFFLAANNKFYAPARTIDGTMQVTMDYVFMRIAEIYLLNAEMAAKTGNDGAARTSLKAVVSLRRPGDVAYIDGLAGQTLEDEIYLQTRLELYGEGKSYLAMKRNRATVTRGTNNLFHNNTSYQYNDPKLRFEIPIEEVQNNPNIN